MIFTASPKIKNLGRNLIGRFQRHPAGFLLALSFLFAIYALLIFASYAVNEPPPTTAASNLRIDDALYQRVLGQLKGRDAAIQQGIERTYPDIFR